MSSAPWSRRICTAAALTALIGTPARAEEPATRRYALLVGANDGGPYRVRLRYAHDDVRQMGSVLSDLGGVSPVDRTVLLDPSRADFDAAFVQLAGDLGAVPEGARTEVLFYFSGHSDTEGLRLGEDIVSYVDLRDMLEGLPADVRVGVLDSCASGAMIRNKGGRPISPFMLDESNSISGTAYLTSASEDEEAQEADAIGGSYFTYHLVSGLRGAADSDSDQRVTLNEAYRYAFDQTLATTSTTLHGAQHAISDLDLSGTGELVLTDLTRTSSALVLAEPIDASVLVRDEAGHTVAEMTKRPDVPIVLGLAPGKYVLTFSKDGSYATVDVAIGEGEAVTLGPEHVVWSDGVLAVARGGTTDFEWHSVPARAQLLPGYKSFEIVDHFTFNVLAGRSGRLDGVAIGIGANFTDREVRGAQLALGYNQAGGDVLGLQSALGANYGAGDVGGQLAMGGNWASGDVRGVQAALGGNVTEGAVFGGQLALGANVASEPVRGAQVALGANVAPRSLRGIQLSTGINYGGGVNGAQLGFINVGGEVKGAQIGLVNVGGTVHGVQIGLVNFAKSSPAPIGLLSFVKDGRHDVSVYGSESGLYNLDLKLGGQYFHTVLGSGFTPNKSVWFGLGFGTQPIAKPVFVDIDVSVLSIEPWTQPFGNTDDTLVGRGRIGLGVPIVKGFALFAGGSINGRWWTGEAPVPFPAEFIDSGDSPVVVWPGFYAGIQVL